MNDTTMIYHNLPQPDYVRFVGREPELARLRELLSPDNRAWVIVIDGIGGIGKSALALECAHRYLSSALAHAQKADSETRLPPKYRSQLLQNLGDCFDDNELRALCFDIVVVYDDLPGQSKSDKARELITHLERRGRISDLVARCSELRPRVEWRKTLAVSAPASSVEGSASEILPEKELFQAIIWTSAKATALTADGIAPRRQIVRTLDNIYTTIAVALQREDITRARPEEQDEVVRRALTLQRTLLIIDNLETVDDERVSAFLRELPTPTKCVVTTRHRIDVAYPIRLAEMSRDDALSLIAQECEKKAVTLNDGEADLLYRRTGGVPLAIVWSFAQMGYGYEVETVLRRLGNATGDIALFCFQRTMEHIRGGPAHKLLKALSVFATDAGRKALGYVAALPDLDRDDGLVKLERLSLVNKHRDRFELLPLTKSFALAELAQDTRANELYRRWIDYLKGLCRGVDSEYHWRYMNYAFFDEGENILEAIEWCFEHGTADDVFVLALAANDYTEAVGRWAEIMLVCQRTLNLARSVQNPVAIARFAAIIGWISLQRGEYPVAEALFEEALAQYQSVGNREGESVILQELSSVYRKAGEFGKAKELNDQAWQIAEELGDGDLQTLIRDSYGKLARDMGNWPEAESYFTQVKNWFEKRVGHTPRDEILARSPWGHLAIVAYHLGQLHEAKELCLRSLEFFEQPASKSYMATLKYRLALAEEALGEHDAALKHVTEAVDWFERLGMKPDYGEAIVLLERLQQVRQIADSVASSNTEA